METVMMEDPTGSPPGLYDPFLFVDSLTNRSTPLRDIRRDRPHPTQPQTADPQMEQAYELDRCIDLLRCTSAFRMSALRQRLFASTPRPLDPQDTPSHHNIRKKRLIRSVLAQEIEDKNRQELRLCLQNPLHHPDQHLLQVARSSNFPISKKNVSKIMNCLGRRERREVFAHGKTADDGERSPFVAELTKLEGEIKGELRQKLRKTGEYLVEPKHCFHPSMTGRSKQQQTARPPHQENAEYNALQWAAVPKVESVRKKGRMQKTPNRQQRELMRLVCGAPAVDVEVYAGKCRKEWLRVRDEANNNLLHLAAVHNRAGTFEWLLRTLGVESLLEKNDDKMTAADIAVKLKHREVLNLIPRSLM